jgi:hypothetical protein
MKRKSMFPLAGVLVLAIIFPSAVYSQNAAAEKKGTRIIYLIRHGQYDHGDKRDEYIGRGLVPLGIAQARLLAARLRAMPVEFTSLTGRPPW